MIVDYPHIAASWSPSQLSIKETFGELSEENRHKIVYDTVVHLYGINLGHVDTWIAASRKTPNGRRIHHGHRDRRMYVRSRSL